MRRTSAFALVLAAAVAVNAAQFAAIDAGTSDHFAAIHRYPEGDIVAVAERTNEPFQQMYGLYLAMADLAPGSRVLTLRGNRLARQEIVTRLYSYGQAGEVTRVRAAEPAVDPEPFIVRRGPGGAKGPPWALAMAGPAGTAREFLLLEWNRQDLLIETSLLSEPLRPEPSR